LGDTTEYGCPVTREGRRYALKAYFPGANGNWAAEFDSIVERIDAIATGKAPYDTVPLQDETEDSGGRLQASILAALLGSGATLVTLHIWHLWPFK
jgi:hypothetical protein